MTNTLVAYSVQDLCQRIVGGGTPPSTNSDYWNGSIPWISSSDIGLDGKITIRKYITAEAIEQSATNLVPKGTVLIVSRVGVGKAGIAPTDLCFSQDCQGLVLNHEKVHEDYFIKAIQKSLALLVKKARGATITGVTKDEIKKLKILVPPLQRQIHIANILSKAETLISQRKESIRLLDEFLKSTFLEMFGDTIRNEKGWVEDTIDSVCTEIVDCVNRTAPIVGFVTDYKMIRTTNVRNYKVNFQDLRYVTKETYDIWTRRLVPKRGDIIFTREAPVGEAAIVDIDDKIFLGQRTMHFRPDLRRITPAFLLYQLMGQDLKRQFDRLGSGSTVKHLSVPACKKFVVKVPPIGLQIKFSTIFEKTESLKSQSQTSLLELENLYASLSQRALKGELAINTHSQ